MEAFADLLQIVHVFSQEDRKVLFAARGSGRVLDWLRKTKHPGIRGWLIPSDEDKLRPASNFVKNGVTGFTA